eukprot:4195249-Alexandrium_andersonii.AAC.1
MKHGLGIPALNSAVASPVLEPSGDHRHKASKCGAPPAVKKACRVTCLPTPRKELTRHRRRRKSAL